MLDDIALFVHITQQQGLANAAKHLSLPAATVTRRLQKLEDSMGCKLIYRSARKFSLTTEGEAYYQAYAPLMQQFDDTSRQLGRELHQLSGPLSVLAPPHISIGMLQPMWCAFIKAHPEIQLQLKLNNKNEDFLSSRADLALRIGPQADSQLFQKRLGTISTILIASQEYIAEYGQPETLDDLKNHKLITTDLYPVWPLIHSQSKREVTLHPFATTSLNDIKLAKELAKGGVGIALMPVSELTNKSENGDLTQVLECWHGPQRDIFAIWPSGKLLSAKAKHLRNFMEDYVRSNPILQGEVDSIF